MYPGEGRWFVECGGIDMKHRKIWICFGLVAALFCGCNKISNETSSSTSENNNTISYCAKEESAENRIYFHYPQLEETTENAEKVNVQITSFVQDEFQNWFDGSFSGEMKASPEEWVWDNDVYTDCAMKVEYTIVRNDADYFSVTFDGLYNHKRTPHPTNYFQALTIDKHTGEFISMSDLYTVNSDLVQLIQAKIPEQFAEKYGETSEEITQAAEYVQNALNEDDMRDDEYPIFMTGKELGISISLIYALGDHFEVMIPYEELEAFKK